MAGKLSQVMSAQCRSSSGVWSKGVLDRNCGIINSCFDGEKRELSAATLGNPSRLTVAIKSVDRRENNMSLQLTRIQD